MKLFNVSSHLKDPEYKGVKYPNVPVNWFISDPPAPDRSVLPVVDDDLYRLVATAELFTEVEAEALTRYLWDDHRVVSKVSEHPMPIHDHVMPWSAMPCGAGLERVWLYEELGYSLPFRVVGVVIFHEDPLSQYLPVMD